MVSRSDIVKRLAPKVSVMENFESHGSDHALFEISWLPGIPEYIWLAVSVENWMPLSRKQISYKQLVLYGSVHERYRSILATEVDID
jgi:hypothetical protein